jgi:hypothetical protein
LKRALIAAAALALGTVLVPAPASAAFYGCSKSLTNSGGFSHANVLCTSVVDDDAMYRARAELTRLSDGSHWVFLGPLKNCDNQVSITDSWVTGVYRVDAYGWRVFDDTLGGPCA